MNGGSLNNNTALTRGGAILADSDAVDVKKGALKDNMSRMLGGAVYVMGDHPKYTYTMYLTGLYVHDNVAVSGILEARQAAANGPSSMYTLDELNDFNSKLQTKLNAPSLCGDAGADILGDVFSSPNSDDMNDGWGTHGTGGGVWLCAYGTTYFNAGATSQVVIAQNYATGAVPLNHSIYPRWIKQSSDGKNIRDDIAYNTASSVATGTGRTGGNDLHADTGSSGSVIIKNEKGYPGWKDENASTSEEVQYDLPVSEGRVNIVNNGDAQEMPAENVQVEVSGNVSRRGGGLAANGTFMLGMRDDQANVESAVDLKKTWHATAERKPVSIRVSAVQGTNTAVIADVPLDGEANAPISEYDAVEELAPTGSAWNGRFKLPIELNGTEGKIKVFNLVLKEEYREAGDTDGIIDPTTLQGRAKLAAAIKSIKENHKDPSSGKIDEDGAIEEINSAISIQFSEGLKLRCKEYEIVDGQPVESSSYVFTSKDVDLSEASFDLQSTSFYGEEHNEETGQMEPVEIYQVHVFGIELALSAQNDNNPITEKYVNKEVHSDIVNFDQDFEYDIMAYVPLTAEEFTISDTLVDGLEFAGPGGNKNNDPEQVVRSIAVKTLNNHEPGEEGTVSGPGEPGRNGNPMNLKPGQHPVLPGGKPIDVNTQLGISGKTLTVHVPAGDTLNLLKGKWVQVTFGARIEDKYRNIDALKALSAGVEGKANSWEETSTDKKGTDKKGDPAYEYLVANGDKAIVAPILAEVGQDPVIWAVEAPSRLFARTAKGDYYATPYGDMSGNTWTRLDKDQDDGKDDGYGKPVWINADNRYYGRAPHASNTVKQLGMDDSKLNSLKGMPLVVGSEVTKAAEGATRYFAEVKDAEGGVHIWATDKGDLDSLKWHEVTDKSSDEYVNAQGRLSNDRYTIRMLDLTSDTVTLDPDSETGKNWPVISKEEHEGMANQGSYSVKFGNNAEAKTYKTNTVTVAPETTELDVEKVWAPDNKWPEDVENVIFNIYSKKGNNEKQVYVDGQNNVIAEAANANDKALTVTLTKENPTTTVKDLPKLKGTYYIAREEKITTTSSEGESVKDVTYNSDKSVGLAEQAAAGKDVTVSMSSKLKNARFRDIAEKKPIRGYEVKAEGDDEGRLFAITLGGAYWTKGPGEEAEWVNLDKPVENAEETEADKLYYQADAIFKAHGEDVFDLIEVYTATNSTASVEKYVNEDVHDDLVEYDKVFRYDIMAFVTRDAKKVVLTDNINELCDTIEFAKAPASKEDIATKPAEAVTAGASAEEKAAESVSAIVVKSDNNHKAFGTVSEAGIDVSDKAKIKIEDSKLTVVFDSVDNETGIRGKWLQVTFWAKYTQDAIDKANYKGSKGEKDVYSNGEVISEKYPSSEKPKVSHSGSANKAGYELTRANRPTAVMDTNVVTVKPESVQFKVKKVWEDAEGNEITKWPENIEKVRVFVKNGDKTADTMVIKDLNEVTSKELPKLVGVTYTLEEEAVPGYNPTLIGNSADGYTLINSQGDERPEIEKYVNEAVHKDIDLDETFTYDIIAYVTKDADKVVVTDELNKNLQFADDEVTVLDLGPKVNHKVTNGIDAVTVNKDASVALKAGDKIGDFTVKEVEGALIDLDKENKKLTVTIENKLKIFAEKVLGVFLNGLGDSNSQDDNDANAGQNADNDQNANAGQDVDNDQNVDGGQNPDIDQNDANIDVNDRSNDEIVPTDDGLTSTGSEGNDATDNEAADTVPTDNAPTDNAQTDTAPATDEATDAEPTDAEPADNGGAEYEHDTVDQFVTPLRGHWIKITFKAKIDDKTLEEVRKAYETISADQVEDRARDNVGNAPVISDDDHTGVPNNASYKIDVGNVADVYHDKSNTVTVKPVEKPEIEKYVSKAVHKELGAMDEQFTYDVIAYVTKDADSVQINDTLNTVLEFATDASEVKVEDLGSEVNHKPENNISAKQINKDASVSRQDGQTVKNAKVNINGKILTVDIDDAKALRGHWVRVTFDARIVPEIDGEEILRAYDTVDAGEIYNDSVSGGERDPENVGNSPVISDETHKGIPNTAKYTITVDNEAMYKDTSNTVTVKPDDEVLEEYMNPGEEEDDVADEGDKPEIKEETKKEPAAAKKKSVDTGDDTHISLWIISMIMAALLTFILGLRKRSSL